MKDKKFLTLTGIFLTLFLVGISIIAVENPVSQMLRATNVAPSPLKSFATVFPQIEQLGNQVKVSVYIREVNGRALPNRQVQLSVSDSQVTISPSTAQTTNDIGQVQFFLTSNVPGIFKITATDVATNTNVVNIPTVEFR